MVQLAYHEEFGEFDLLPPGQCFGQFWICFPQIAIAIGVLTSNRGGWGDEPLWRIGRGTRVPVQGAVDVAPLLGAIVGCHCWVPS